MCHASSYYLCLKEQEKLLKEQARMNSKVPNSDVLDCDSR